jgi:hypothetical protein
VSASQVFGDQHQFHPDYLEPGAFQPADYLTGQTALHTVGFHKYQCSLS